MRHTPAAPATPRGYLARLLEGLVTLQLHRPWRVLLGSLAFALLGAGLSTRLELRTRFDQLLPDNSASVRELHRVARETEQRGQIFVFLQGERPASLRAFADALVPRLEALGPPWVASAASGVHAARSFLLPRAGMFADLDELERLDAALGERWDWEVGAALGVNLSDEPPRIDVDELLASTPSRELEGRFPDGYFQAPDGKAVVVVVRTGIAGDDLDNAETALERVKGRVADFQRASDQTGVRVGYAGDLVTSLSEYGAMSRDIVGVGTLGVSLVLLAVLLFFMRLRALFVLGLAIGSGLCWTFGLAALAIGQLNLASGFLTTLVAGNSINHGIIFTARLFQEQRSGKSLGDALMTAHRETTPATFTAALAAVAAYASLAVSSFPMLRHFAAIGAAGMFLCWLATLLVVPAALVVFERARPLCKEAGGLVARLRRSRLALERPFVHVVARFPGAITVLGVALTLGGFVASLGYLRAWPTERDMRRLQNDLGQASELYRASHRCAEILGAEIESSMLVLADRPDQIPSLKRALEARRDAAPAGQEPFEAVHTLFDFVPAGQAEKLPILRSIRERLLRLMPRLEPDVVQRVEPLVPPADLAPFTSADLPEDVARPFTDKHGVRGRIALIEPTAGHSDSDLDYLTRWVDGFRETRLPNGEVIRGSGRAVIFADILSEVQAATPRALALSLAATTLVVALLFGAVQGTALVVAPLCAGLCWLGLFMSVAGVRLNFLNFIALPITFGIAVDYSVNLLRRLHFEPRHGVLAALSASGGPVALSSLTTLLGYLVLLGSINQAIRSLGLLCVVGEVACLLAAILLLPAALVCQERRARGRRVREPPRGVASHSASERAAEHPL